MTDKTRIHPALILAACVVVTLLVGFLDFLSDEEFELYLLYLIPIGAVAWLAGKRPALLMAVLAIVVAFLADWGASRLLPGRWVAETWNNLIQGAIFLLVAWLASQDKEMLDRERHLNGQLRQALAQVRQLSGLLPVCVSCKKVRNDQGYWEAVEDYLRTHSMAEVSQGLCPDCMQRRLGQS